MDASTITSLRRAVAAIEGRQAATLAAGPVTLRRFAGGAVATGAPAFDRALGGGLPARALTEIVAAAREAGAAAGFALALAGLLPPSGRPLLWVAPRETFGEAGWPHAPGLRPFLGTMALVVAPARSVAEALWIAGEAAGTGAPAAIVLEVRGDHARLDLTATRRLNWRARATGRPVFLVRLSAAPAPTAAPVRLAVAAAPQAGPLFLPGARFAVAVDKTPAARPAAFTLEWNADERRFLEQPARQADPGAVVAAPVGRPRLPAPARSRLAG